MSRENSVAAVMCMNNIWNFHFEWNFHGTEVVSVTRTQKDRSQLGVLVSKVCTNYNKHMGGDNKTDMLCAIYGLNRK